MNFILDSQIQQMIIESTKHQHAHITKRNVPPQESIWENDYHRVDDKISLIFQNHTSKIMHPIKVLDLNANLCNSNQQHPTLDFTS